MRSLIRILIRKFLARTSGRKKYQRFYSLLHDIALKGMNFGAGDHKTSGELPVLQLIANNYFKNSPALVIFDIGANIGDYAAELSTVFGEKSRIYSFEPSRSTFEKLIERTSQIKNIHPVNCGFSDAEGVLNLHSDPEISVLASVYARDLSAIDIHMDQMEQIEVSTIDHYCKVQQIEKIHFLKIDVEGHELNVLKGGKHMLSNNHVDIIQFEFGEACIDARNYLRDFYEILHNYDFFRVVKDGLFPLGNYRSENEIFRTINLVAIRKGYQES
jgi:FkbM family methyltransferase